MKNFIKTLIAASLMLAIASSYSAETPLKNSAGQASNLNRVFPPMKPERIEVRQRLEYDNPYDYRSTSEILNQPQEISKPIVKTESLMKPERVEIQPRIDYGTGYDNPYGYRP